jgi:1,4-alpha-glucan branching enzyme
MSQNGPDPIEAGPSIPDPLALDASAAADSQPLPDAAAAPEPPPGAAEAVETLLAEVTADPEAAAATPLEPYAGADADDGSEAVAPEVAEVAEAPELEIVISPEAVSVVEDEASAAAEARPAAQPSARAGMGATLYDGGVAFRVWAPNADAVSVAGTFNGWKADAAPLAREEGGLWSVDVDGAAAGAEYRFVITNGAETLWKIDPYARDVTSSVGNAVVVDPAFDWGDEGGYQAPPWNELVIYEVHVGTFNDAAGDAPGTFDTVAARLPYLRDLGINCIELMPSLEFAADFGWGYNPAHIFAIESAYGGPAALKSLVKAAHEHGIAVIFDVVYNHFGPSDLDHSLWRFDGWSEGAGGGIYFYNDERRAKTEWGHTRPDYGRPEVRAFIRDNARMWLEEFRMDGLRWDATAYVRNVAGNNDNPAGDLPDGWRLLQEVTGDTDARQPWKLHIAEDLRGNAWITRAAAEDGAGFDTQWDGDFVHPVRRAVIADRDDARSMHEVRRAISSRFNGNPLQRVVYTESHDEVANGHSRVPTEIFPGQADSWFSRKRSTLGAALVFTSPGIPMLFQGQEILEDHWFKDDVPIDWTRLGRFAGIHALYRDLARLRRNWHDHTRGLRGAHVNVHHVNDADKVIAFHRWENGGARDDVVVVANFSNRAFPEYVVGLPRAGEWKVRFNSDAQVYGADFGAQDSFDLVAVDSPRDGLPFSGAVGIGPYTAVILSQDD